jgi:hypothetical protein
MDYGFTLISVTMLFLNHSGAVAIRFTLLDNRAVTIAVPITVVAFANSCASAYGTNSNSNIVRQSWRRNGSYGSNDQSVPHSNLLQCEPLMLMKPVVESSRSVGADIGTFRSTRNNVNVGEGGQAIVGDSEEWSATGRNVAERKNGEECGRPRWQTVGGECMAARHRAHRRESSHIQRYPAT